MSENETNTFDILAKVVSVVGLVVLSFIVGAYTTEFKTFPYPQLLQGPFKAMKAYEMRVALTNPNPKKSNQWHRVQNWKPGVVKHEQQKTYDGYTLFTSAHATAAFLIDMNGDVVHEWGVPFRRAFPDGGKISNPVPEHKIQWSDAHMFPNGDLIGVFTVEGDTPYGYGLVKVDKNSNILWTYDGRVHHDFDVEDDGTIWALTHEFRNLNEKPIPGGPNWNSRILEDFLVKLSPEGKELKRISLVDVVAAHEKDVIREWFWGEAKWDMLHMNDVDEIGSDFAEHHHFAEPGQIMFSSRSLSAIGLVDPDKEKLVWISKGFWKKQHDPDALPNGNILIFDNKGYSGPGGRTQIATFKPQTRRIDWSFHGTKQQKFQCLWWGKQSMLPNDNVLIADTLNGRIIEVNRDQEIVWEWHTPSTANFKGQIYAPNIKAPVERFKPNELQFEPARPPKTKSKLFPHPDRFKKDANKK